MGNRTLLDVLTGETALINANRAAASAETDVGVAAYTVLSAMGRLTANTIQGIAVRTIFLVVIDLAGTTITIYYLI